MAADSGRGKGTAAKRMAEFTAGVAPIKRTSTSTSMPGRCLVENGYQATRIPVRFAYSCIGIEKRTTFRSSSAAAHEAEEARHLTTIGLKLVTELLA